MTTYVSGFRPDRRGSHVITEAPNEEIPPGPEATQQQTDRRAMTCKLNTTRLHYVLLSLIFFGQGAALIGLEVTAYDRYFVGYWNGTLAILCSISMTLIILFTTNWSIALFLCISSFTTLGCITASLASPGKGNSTYLAVYWVDLTLLITSIYSSIFILVKHGFSGYGSSRQNSMLVLSAYEAGMPRQGRELQPPEGFILPSELPRLPDYDNLSEPPSYGEAVDEEQREHCEETNRQNEHSQKSNPEVVN